MLEMKVFGLALDENNQAPVLILKDLKDEAGLPIWIGAMEAMAISMVLNKVAFPRPMTHDLLLNVIAGMGGKLARVEITALEEGTYFADLVVIQNGQPRRIDARPSDAVALALRAEAPILVAETVLARAGTADKAAPKPTLLSGEADRWTDVLEKFSVDDTKYKM